MHQRARMHVYTSTYIRQTSLRSRTRARKHAYCVRTRSYSSAIRRLHACSSMHHPLLCIICIVSRAPLARSSPNECTRMYAPHMPAFAPMVHKQLAWSMQCTHVQYKRFAFNSYLHLSTMRHVTALHADKKSSFSQDTRVFRWRSSLHAMRRVAYVHVRLIGNSSK